MATARTTISALRQSSHFAPSAEEKELVIQYQSVFQEAKAIRSALKDETKPEEHFRLYFTRSFFKVLLNRCTPGLEKYPNYNKDEFFFFLTAIITDHTKYGNCEEQASFAFFKMLMKGIRYPTELVKMLGLDLKTLSLDGHTYVLTGHNEQRENGYLSDVLGKTQIVRNPGEAKIAESWDLQSLGVDHSFRVERNYTAKKWSNLANYIAYIQQFLTPENYNNMKKEILKEMVELLMRGRAKVHEHMPLMKATLEQFNLSSFHNTLTQWKDQCEALEFQAALKELSEAVPKLTRLAV